MQKLVLVVLDKNQDAYDLFFKLKANNYCHKGYLILEGAVFRKENEHFHYLDGFAQTHDGLAFLQDGLLSHFSLIIGQPTYSSLDFPGKMGFVWRNHSTGRLKQDLDFDQDINTRSFFNVFHCKIDEGQYGVVLHISETDESKLDKIFEDYNPLHVFRADAKNTYYEVCLGLEYNEEMKESHEKGGGISNFHDVAKRAEEIEDRAKKSADELEQNVKEKVDSLTQHHENKEK